MFSQFTAFLKTFLIYLSLFIPHSTLIVGDSEAGIASHYINDIKEKNETVYFDYKVGSIIQYWFGSNFQNALDKHPDIDTVIIFLGTNNIGREKELDLSPILNKIKKYNCIWVSPPRVHNKHWKFNSLLQKNIENQSNCRFFQSESLDLDLPDGYHPTPFSMRIWLESIWQFKGESQFENLNLNIPLIIRNERRHFDASSLQ